MIKDITEINVNLKKFIEKSLHKKFPKKKFRIVDIQINHSDDELIRLEKLSEFWEEYEALLD